MINIRLRVVGYFSILVLQISSMHTVAEEAFGTFKKPFSVDSLWNSKPLNPKLDSFEIPTSLYFPAVQQGIYSTAAFVATSTDPEMKVYGFPDKKGIWDPDSEQLKPFVKIAHWPKEVTPAIGSDGHADIVDDELGIIHSFWQLKFKDGRWAATQYAWTKIDGRGWADPAHYFQGARAAAVPTVAGIIRQHEIEDGKSMYEHALAISLTYNALSPKPAYIFPATSADTNASTLNTGKIPEGALLMLPASFDESKIQTANLKKIVKTLKTYGAYVVDNNYGTPFVIYVETGAVRYVLNRPMLAWDNQVANELQVIRAGLRQVIATDGWFNGRGEAFTPEKSLNLLSMRGPWTLQQGSVLGEFDTLKQAVVFEKTTSATLQENVSGRSMQLISWAKPQKDDEYSFKAITTGGAKVGIKVIDKAQHKVVFQSKLLGDSESINFTWPVNDFTTTLLILSGVGNNSSAKAELKKVESIK